MRKFTLFAARSVALCARIFVALCATLALCAALSGCSGMINGDPNDGRGSSSGGSSYNDPSTTSYYGNVTLYFGSEVYEMYNTYETCDYSLEPCFLRSFNTSDSVSHVYIRTLATDNKVYYPRINYTPQTVGENSYVTDSYYPGGPSLPAGGYTIKFFPRSQKVKIICLSSPSQTGYYGDLQLLFDSSWHTMDAGYGSYNYGSEPRFTSTLYSSNSVNDVEIITYADDNTWYYLHINETPAVGSTVSYSTYSYSDYSGESLPAGEYTFEFFPMSQTVRITRNR